MLNDIINFFKRIFGLNKPEPVTVQELEVIVTLEPIVQEAVTEAKPKRTRSKRGQFKADDPATPQVNEAWTTGKSPAKPKPTIKK
jgi:hypothetical protein